MKLPALSNCPVHKCQPLFIGPGIDLPNDLDTSPFSRNGRMYHESRWYVLQQIFPDALIFDSQYTVFCPECAKHNPFSNKHNKFGYGFCSQYSLNAACRNWNAACERFFKSQIHNDLNNPLKHSKLSDQS